MRPSLTGAPECRIVPDKRKPMPGANRSIVKIESVAFGGEGVGRIDGLAVFVPFTAPADLAEIEIIDRRKKFARGRLLEILEPSLLRTRPLCRYYGRCGGCCYQHIDYDGQLAAKKKQVADAFSRIGGISDPPLRNVIGSPERYSYRGKALLHAQKTAGGFHLGFMDITGGRLVDIERCEIVHETINDQIRRQRSAPLAVRAQGDVVFWSDDSGGPADAVVRTVGGKDFLVPRTGFFQANLSLVGRMVDEVCALLAGKKADTLVDACCGSGLFSIFLAPYAERIIGVEINEKSVKFARRNAEKHGIGYAEFVRGDVEEVLGGMAKRKETVDVLLLDPPRVGVSGKVLAAAADLKTADIIYVSCNPVTQARDVQRLAACGYRLESLCLLDMFPQTEHIETIAFLRRG